MQCCAGIVEYQIEAVVLSYHIFDYSLGVLVNGHVQVGGQRTAPLLADQAAHLLGPFLIDIDRDHRRSTPAEFFTERPAEPGGAASDHGNLVFLVGHGLGIDSNQKRSCPAVTTNPETGLPDSLRKVSLSMAQI